MNVIVVAALIATLGFAGGDVFTALLARRVSGKASMLLLTLLRILLYLPLIVIWRTEFSHLNGVSLAWIGLLGIIFAVAYWGFNMALQLSKNPALVGVIAGCFPASASIVAIVWLGQHPTTLTLALLVTVLAGVILIGLPQRWEQSFEVDKGILLAMLPLVGWGVFGALLHIPVGQIGTPHAWFVVQSMIALVMALAIASLLNRQIPSIFAVTTRKRSWTIALAAGAILGIAEASQAFALSSGQNLVAVETLLGSYPAAYFLIAHRIFKEPLRPRQWFGIGLVAVAIVLLSISTL